MSASRSSLVDHAAEDSDDEEERLLQQLKALKLRKQKQAEKERRLEALRKQIEDEEAEILASSVSPPARFQRTACNRMARGLYLLAGPGLAECNSPLGRQPRAKLPKSPSPPSCTKRRRPPIMPILLAMVCEDRMQVPIHVAHALHPPYLLTSRNTVTSHYLPMRSV
jgi:hypothetical protein